MNALAESSVAPACASVTVSLDLVPEPTVSLKAREQCGEQRSRRVSAHPQCSKSLEDLLHTFPPAFTQILLWWVAALGVTDDGALGELPLERLRDEHRPDRVDLQHARALLGVDGCQT